MATVIKIKTGTATPTTSDITDREVAIDKTAQKFYINDGGTIKEIAGAAAQGNAFANIAVSGQDTVEADTSTDTLTIVGTGLNSISTAASSNNPPKPQCCTSASAPSISIAQSDCVR